MQINLQDKNIMCFNANNINLSYSLNSKKSKDINADDVFLSNNNILDLALSKLENLTFSPEDIEKVKKYGVRLIFNNGKEAVDFAKNNNIKILFAPVSQKDIHAQWDKSLNSVIINDRYKHSKNLAEMYAISAAILHELAHAKDGDDVSSIQEEIDCLGMNVLAFNVFRKKNPNLFENANSPIIADGVNLYADLFLGDNVEALKDRIYNKYGNLLLASAKHAPSPFAISIIKDRFLD